MEEPITKPTDEQIKQYMEGQVKEKKKSNTKWWIGWGLLAVAVICLIVINTMRTQSTTSVLDKTSGFTENDCNEICNISFPTRIQTTDCQQKICYVIGKPGALMDKNCLDLIKEYDKNVVKNG